MGRPSIKLAAGLSGRCQRDPDSPGAHRLTAAYTYVKPHKEFPQSTWWLGFSGRKTVRLNNVQRSKFWYNSVSEVNPPIVPSVERLKFLSSVISLEQ